MIPLETLAGVVYFLNSHEIELFLGDGMGCFINSMDKIEARDRNSC